MDDYHLKSFHASSKPDGEDAYRSYMDDDDNLVRMGKKPVLKRNFGFMAILGFSCTILVTWEGSLVLFLEGFSNGGPAGVVYSYIYVWIGTFATFATLSELASMAPTSGGQYHWTSMLAPRSAYKFYSFLAGWLTFLGWQANVASGSYLSGTMVQGLATLCNPSYMPTPWQSTLTIWAVIAFAVFINVAASGLLPRFEGLILILHVLGFFAILIPLVHLSDHNPAEFVFTTFLNEGKFQTQGLSFMVGMVGNMFAFMGADAAFHMAEEIRNASTLVPRSIMISIALNGTLGFAMIMAALFSLGDLDAVLKSPTGYPFMEIFHQATKSIAGSAVMASIVVILAISATVGGVATCSRMIFAFARDRGMPGWSILKRVDSRTSIPVFAVMLATGIGCLLALVVIGSSTVFNDVVSLSVSSLFSSYLLCTALLLWRRCTGGIRNISEIPVTDTVLNVPGAPLVWGPFRIPGIWGIISNTVAIIYLTIGVFFSLWPASLEVTASTMNYSVVGTGGVIILSILYYVLYAKGRYNGPIMEVLRD